MMSNVDKVGTKARCISHGDNLFKDSVQKRLRYLLLASGVGSGEKSTRNCLYLSFIFTVVLMFKKFVCIT